MEICVHSLVASDSQTQHKEEEELRCRDTATALLKGFTPRKLSVFQPTTSGTCPLKVWTPQTSAPVVTAFQVEKIEQQKTEKARVHVDICEDLEEFQPQYSLMCKGKMRSIPFKKPWTPVGKSCLVTRKMRRKNEIPHISPLVRNMIKVRKEMDRDDVMKNKPDRAKRKWYAAPFSKSDCKRKVRSADLSVKGNKKMKPLERGKWILRAPEDVITRTWKTMCGLLTQGRLAHCNCKLEGAEEIWLYCNICQAGEIGDVLKAELMSSVTMEFWVHTHGLVMTR